MATSLRNRSVLRCIALAAVLGLAYHATSAQDVADLAGDELNRILPPGPQQQSARCKLQHALWGRYNLRLYATRTNDGKPHLLQIRDGRFFDEIDPNPRLGAGTRFERDGRLVLTSPTEAFRRGVPFFIQRVAVDSPTAIRVTVVSGPENRVNSAMVVAVIENPEHSDDFPYVRRALLGKPVQEVVLEHGALATATTVRVAIMQGLDVTDIAIGCLLSNEVDASAFFRR